LLNAFGSFQSVALLGSDSDIGKQILNNFEKANIRKLYLFSRSGASTFETAIPICVDFSSPDDRKKAVKSIFADGDLDCAIIAFGVLNGSLMELMNINYVATAELLYEIAEKMRIQGHGQILIISSFAQIRPRTENFAYGSTKSGLDFFARGLAAALEGSGVRITILRPGFVHSKMTKGMKKQPFSITSELAGELGAKALRKSQLVSYAPKVLGLVAIVFRILPEKFFRVITKSQGDK
jgi:decaprenylphospho-beta-D-erythro-pentofuranosid-2-ulose 2-reductase